MPRSVEVLGVWTDYGYDHLELEVINPATGELFVFRSPAYLVRDAGQIVEAFPEDLRYRPYQ